MMQSMFSQELVEASNKQFVELTSISFRRRLVTHCAVNKLTRCRTDGFCRSAKI